MKKHSGAAKARNVGIKTSKGNLLLFIDADAWFNKATIYDLIKQLDENTDIVFPKITYENGHLLYPVFEEEKKYPHITGCFLIKKNSLKKLDEHFDEFYETYLEDYDFFIRSKLSSLNAKYIENARVIHANKELGKDYSERYFLEVRNLFYGFLKLGKMEKKSIPFNPFTLNNIIKSFFLGLLNFAWFNWYGYDRKSTTSKKLTLILKERTNKISNKSITNIALFFKAFSEIIKNYRIISRKKISLIRYYQPKKIIKDFD